MIFSILIVFYVIVVLLMIGVILLQEPKGGGLSSALGGTGGMENILGVRGAPSFFVKLTAILGTIFVILSLVLSMMHAPTVQAKSAIEKEIKKGLNLPPLPGGGEQAPGQGAPQPTQPSPKDNPQTGGG